MNSALTFGSSLVLNFCPEHRIFRIFKEPENTTFMLQNMIRFGPVKFSRFLLLHVQHQMPIIKFVMVLQPFRN